MTTARYNMTFVEYLLAFMKTLPNWLMNVVDVLIITVLFATSITFLAGIWVGLMLVGKRANSIQEISLFPPKITFVNKEKEQE